MIAMRNSARQRRQYRKFFPDMAILTNEANYTDEYLLSQKGVQANQFNTSCLSLSIGMTLEMMEKYLLSTMQLELIRTEELPMFFNQARYVYKMFNLNRKNTNMYHMTDLIKSGLVQPDELNQEITPKWKQRRRQMTTVQRLFCDQQEVYLALADAYQGLYFLSVAAQINNAIKPYTWNEVDQ